MFSNAFQQVHTHTSDDLPVPGGPLIHFVRSGSCRYFQSAWASSRMYNGYSRPLMDVKPDADKDCVQTNGSRSVHSFCSVKVVVAKTRTTKQTTMITRRQSKNRNKNTQDEQALAYRVPTSLHDTLASIVFMRAFQLTICISTKGNIQEHETQHALAAFQACNPIQT